MPRRVAFPVHSLGASVPFSERYVGGGDRRTAQS
jgi:hypothetical protein